MSDEDLNKRGGPRRIGRSIGAFFAGSLVSVFLSLGTDIGLHAAGVFPALGQPMSTGLLLLATVYRAIYGVAGSYVMARLAPYRPMEHTLMGGVVGLVVNIVGTVVTWTRGWGRIGIRSRLSFSRCQPPGSGANFG